MANTLATLGGGVVLGVSISFAAITLTRPDAPLTGAAYRDIADVPVMTRETAEKHRDEQYSGLDSIRELVALPTDFARSAALYSLADRSDSARVQNLIFEANRIADESERVRFLNTLFFRLAELDPHSALVLARSEDFGGIKSIERTVWRAWARKDLEDALHAAKTQTSLAHENAAAQSLFAAFGYMGNETTNRIEAELGVGPDRSSRGRYLYGLADQSPEKAIAFINSLERGVEQEEYVAWLAYYVSLGDPYAALANAPLFRVAADGDRFQSIIKSNIARNNPRATIDRLLADRASGRDSGEFHNAMRSLASTDLDAARDYFKQAESEEDRRTIGSIIAAELAKSNPDEALAWADENDTGQFPMLRMSVLAQIAETDQQRAFTEALKTPNAQVRARVVSGLIQRTAWRDPSSAVAYLDQIEDKQQRLEASRQLASAWIRKDPEAATGWILGQEKEAAGTLLQSAAFQLLHSDIDAAIQLLPKLRESDQAGLRQQIAERLASGRSPTDAQAFVMRFEGQPGYDQLQASVISGVAKTDVFMAKQLADQLSSGPARDRAYMKLISRQSRTDPVQALGWLSTIDNELMRGAAAGQLAAQWFGTDPTASVHWVSGLPRGSLRDDAIMHMSSEWREPSAEQQRLIASIEDPDKRGQAKIQRVYRLMRTDPAKVRKLLQDEDIPSNVRQELEIMINQYGSRF